MDFTVKKLDLPGKTSYLPPSGKDGFTGGVAWIRSRRNFGWL